MHYTEKEKLKLLLAMDASAEEVKKLMLDKYCKTDKEKEKLSMFADSCCYGMVESIYRKVLDIFNIK